MFYKYFLLACVLSFHSLKSVFQRTEIFNFIKLNLSTCLFVAYAFVFE